MNDVQKTFAIMCFQAMANVGKQLQASTRRGLTENRELFEIANR
jgi:hypothetical protein